jgi:thiamine biosynthesis lipoprotein
MDGRTEFVLGTFCRIRLYEQGTPEIYERLFARLGEIDALMSANRPDSELSLINAAAGIAPVPVSPELMTVLEKARYFAEASGGAFDPTVGPLVKLWGIGSDGPEEASPPDPEKIAEALGLINWRNLILDRSPGTAFLAGQGMSLDLGAIAKGYAADELVRILREAGLNRAIIDLGGNIYALGVRVPKSSGEKDLPWRIGIQNPLDDRGVYTGIVELKDCSVVTSGVYERFFIHNGKRYHHILDTATGFPVENSLLSVTIIASSSMDADALSTAVFALGYEKGRALAERERADALFIFEDKTIRGTGGAFALFKPGDTSFRVAGGRE